MCGEIDGDDYANDGDVGESGDEGGDGQVEEVE